MAQSRLADIADHAGVSEATVSRVLNDRPGVADRTRDAVLTAIDVLGYERPSRLRVKEAGLVGLILPELTNPIFPAFAQAIETLLSRQDFTPVLCTQTVGGRNEDEYVRMLLDRGVAGIIYVSGQHADSSADPTRYHELRERGLPIVLVNGYVEGLDVPFVSNDDVASMEIALRHLTELGHTRIGLAVGPDGFVPVIRKIIGFREAMGSFSSSTDINRWIQSTLFTVEGGAAAARALVEAGTTAIVCGSDLMALGAIRQLRNMGLQVPDDISVIGYDDSLLMQFTDPPLTTIRQNVNGMAEAAVRTMVDVMAGRTVSEEFLFRPELIVRGSTGAARS